MQPLLVFVYNQVFCAASPDHLMAQIVVKQRGMLHR